MGPKQVRMARLQNEVGTTYFVRGTNLLTKTAPKFSPKCSSLYFVGPKEIPPNFPQISPPKSNIRRQASAGTQGEKQTICAVQCAWQKINYAMRFHCDLHTR